MPEDPIIGLGNYHVSTCTRSVEGGLCGKPSTVHVVWEEFYHSNACEVHRRELEGKYFLAKHRFGMYCADPRAMWFEEENYCRIPENDRDYDRGTFLLS